MMPQAMEPVSPAVPMAPHPEAPAPQKPTGLPCGAGPGAAPRGQWGDLGSGCPLGEAGSHRATSTAPPWGPVASRGWLLKREAGVPVSDFHGGQHLPYFKHLLEQGWEGPQQQRWPVAPWAPWSERRSDTGGAPSPPQKGQETQGGPLPGGPRGGWPCLVATVGWGDSGHAAMIQYLFRTLSAACLLQ